MSRPVSTYLTNYLQPLEPHLARADVTDIYLNRPGEIWLESLVSGIKRVTVAELTANALERLCRQIAAYSDQGINREHPILAASLPDGSRVQIIAPPATRGHVAMAIRKHLVINRRLSDYAVDGSFERLARREGANSERDEQLASALASGDYPGALTLAVRQKRNILVSGGTSTGKSTFLNALISEIPDQERLILIEDTPELKLRHENAVGLIAPRSALGESTATQDDLLNASLRMRPDRIIVGEVRGKEAFTFLRAINTGHPGSMTSIHADSPQRALEQLALLVLQTGTQLRREDVINYVASVIDVYVQLHREGGRRHVSDIQLAWTQKGSSRVA